MTGAPNCQNPAWTDAEKLIIGKAWDVQEAWENHLAAFVRGSTRTLSVIPLTHARTFNAIRSCWWRLHPVMDSHNTRLERLIGEALDELERVTA